MPYTTTDTLNFGRYKGFTIEEVYLGWEYPTQEFVSTFIGEQLKKMDPYLWKNGTESYNILVVDHELLSNNLIEITYATNLPSSQYVSEALNQGCKVTEDLINLPNSFVLYQVECFKKSFKIFSDRNYLFWCIMNIPSFCLEEESLSELKNKARFSFKGISFKLEKEFSEEHFNRSVFTYTVLHTNLTKKTKLLNAIPESILDKNRWKLNQESKDYYEDGKEDDYDVADDMRRMGEDELKKESEGWWQWNVD